MSAATSETADSAASGTGAASGALTKPGRNELGRVTVHERVVGRIAARAATEVPHAGSAAPRLLGRAVSGAVPGVRGTQLGAAPKVAVDVDLSVATVEVAISVRWPASVPEVSAAVRARIIGRLKELTGLQVTDVRVHVTDLVTHVDAPPRVR
ncbi:Uncharacterized conserved protein YloU, alkaline shock protein (Asp23) family [Jatrophihabitans endophyticus]|uniref:Uncharacterized conserved protein YloU, alkaline shock protein (Asp23) family n=1 Tax=Jatrophihabitans endophyticus TaxID=1206085 RepID=A0A1M5CMW0_9ACTN|nr:Asp23/Gls24 family envelope stress response protein [Jatrophihabitans endophyticus]SHF56050.1 Uncharacterized conserved protein YloU, alkaline shock protein (Asp23) family [Jatrophihabitans endophyticus]